MTATQLGTGLAQYTRAAVDHYIGSYLTLRPAFSVPGTIVERNSVCTWNGIVIERIWVATSTWFFARNSCVFWHVFQPGR